MFFRLFKARLKIISKSRVYIIWTLLFPLALGTLFYFAFSSIYGTIQSSPIPVVIEVKDSAIEEYQRLQAFSYLDRDRMDGVPLMITEHRLPEGTLKDRKGALYSVEFDEATHKSYIFPVI